MTDYFAHLNYSLGDEDSTVECHLLPRAARNVAAIAGSGGRVLPLIAKHPVRLSCFDIHKEQLDLTRLRIESARAFDLEEFAAFWGYPPSPMSPRQRQDRFRCLPLPASCAATLSALFEQNEWSEIIYIGRFERMFATLATINWLFTGEAGARLFECETIEAQGHYLRTSFPGWRWRAVLALVANSTVLNSLLYKGEFPRKNIPGSTYANFRGIYGRLFNDIRLKESFFAQLSFFGRLITREAGLMEIQPPIFKAIKEALGATDIQYVQGDIIAGIAAAKAPYDFVSLSDVPSFMPPETAPWYLRDIRPGLRPGAVVIARGALRVIVPQMLGYDDISGTIAELCHREKTQLWHINAYQRTAES